MAPPTRSIKTTMRCIVFMLEPLLLLSIHTVATYNILSAVNRITLQSGALDVPSFLTQNAGSRRYLPFLACRVKVAVLAIEFINQSRRNLDIEPYFEPHINQLYEQITRFRSRAFVPLCLALCRLRRVRTSSRSDLLLALHSGSFGRLCDAQPRPHGGHARFRRDLASEFSRRAILSRLWLVDGNGLLRCGDSSGSAQFSESARLGTDGHRGECHALRDRELPVR